jgi:hypothetical protein
MSAGEYWLVTVPTRGDTPETAFAKISRGTRDHADINMIDVPDSVVVGTLDSLMALR